MGETARLFVEEESLTDSNILRDILALVAFIMVVVGALITDVNYSIFNLPIMTILNIMAGLLGLFLTLSLLKKHIHCMRYLFFI